MLKPKTDILLRVVLWGKIVAASLAAVLAVLFLAIFLCGCSAALIDRLSSEAYDGKATEPFVNEHPIGVDNGATGISKRLIVHNPLPVMIEARLGCSSMFQDNPTLVVRARTSKFILISTGHAEELTQTCFLLSYRVVTP